MKANTKIKTSPARIYTPAVHPTVVLRSGFFFRTTETTSVCVRVVSSTRRYRLRALGLGWTPCITRWPCGVRFGLCTRRSVIPNKQMNASRRHGNAITARGNFTNYSQLQVCSTLSLIFVLLAIKSIKLTHNGDVSLSSCFIAEMSRRVSIDMMLVLIGFNKVYITSQNVDRGLSI